MVILRIVFRITRLCFAILAGCILTLLFQRGSMDEHSLSSKITSWWHKRITSALGITVKTFGTTCNDATLIIANHISWFDIIAFGGTLPVHFLAKIEVKHTPILGWLATRAGTLYMERGNKKATKNAINTMADTLSNDQHVVLFAEGTTRDGTDVRFHSRLVQSAIDADCHIQPVAVVYPSASGRYTHPAALFMDDITMEQSFLNILKTPNLVAELHFLEPFLSSGKTRDELTRYAEDKVNELIKKRFA